MAKAEDGRKVGAHAVEITGGEVGERVSRMLVAMNESIPEGSNAGEVIGAIGRMMLIGFDCHPPAERLKAFDDWVKWHRDEMIKALPKTN